MCCRGSEKVIGSRMKAGLWASTKLVLCLIRLPPTTAKTRVFAIVKMSCFCAQAIAYVKYLARTFVFIFETPYYSIENDYK